jgi:hypothetical protein
MNQLNMFKQILIHYASSKVENFKIKTSLFNTKYKGFFALHLIIFVESRL